MASVGLDHRGRNFRLSADAAFQEHKPDQLRPSLLLAPGNAVRGAPDALSNFSQP